MRYPSFDNVIFDVPFSDCRANGLRHRIDIAGLYNSRRSSAGIFGRIEGLRGRFEIVHLAEVRHIYRRNLDIRIRAVQVLLHVGGNWRRVSLVSLNGGLIFV